METQLTTCNNAAVAGNKFKSKSKNYDRFSENF